LFGAEPFEAASLGHPLGFDDVRGGIVEDPIARTLPLRQFMGFLRVGVEGWSALSINCRATAEQTLR
jgi:hypothetical protein